MATKRIHIGTIDPDVHGFRWCTSTARARLFRRTEVGAAVAVLVWRAPSSPLVALVALSVVTVAIVLERGSDADEDAVHVTHFVLTAFMVEATFERLPTHIGDGLLAGAPLWLAVPILVVVMDGVQYLSHRTAHAFTPLYALHATHHLGGRFRVGLAAHRHPVADCIERLPGIAVLGLLGAEPLAVSATLGVMLVWGLITHAHRLEGRFPSWASLVLVTPEVHRQHHDVHEGTNLGGVLTVWDRVAGTWAEPETAAFADVDPGARTWVEDMFTPVRVYRHLSTATPSAVARVETDGRVTDGRPELVGS